MKKGSVVYRAHDKNKITAVILKSSHINNQYWCCFENLYPKDKIFLSKKAQQLLFSKYLDHAKIYKREELIVLNL